MQLLRFAVAGVAALYLALSLGSGFDAGRVLSFLAAVWITWRINRYTFAASGGAVVAALVTGGGGRLGGRLGIDFLGAKLLVFKR